MRFGQPVNGEFDLETFSRGIDNCFGPDAERKSQHARQRPVHRGRVDHLVGRDHHLRQVA